MDNSKKENSGFERKTADNQLDKGVSSTIEAAYKQLHLRDGTISNKGLSAAVPMPSEEFERYDRQSEGTAKPGWYYMLDEGIRKMLDEDGEGKFLEEDLLDEFPQLSQDISNLFTAFRESNVVEFSKALKVIFSDRAKNLHKYGISKNVEASNKFAKEMVPHMIKAKQECDSYVEIAHYFNSHNIRTRRGKLFSNSTIMRLEHKQRELGLL